MFCLTVVSLLISWVLYLTSFDFDPLCDQDINCWFFILIAFVLMLRVSFIPLSLELLSLVQIHQAQVQ